MSEQRDRGRRKRRPATASWAAVVGVSGAFLLAVLLTCILVVLSATVALVSPRLVDHMVVVLSTGPPGFVLAAVVLLGSGYLAASTARSHKLLSGALVGGVLLAVCAATAALAPHLSALAVPALATGPRWLVLGAWAFLVVGPVLGAYAQAAVAREGEPPRAARMARLLLGYSLLVAGTFVLCTLLLALALFPGRIQWSDSATALPRGYSTVATAALALALGVAALAGGLYLLVRGRGWERAILTNWLAYALLAWILFYVSLFAYRDLVNRPQRESLRRIALRINTRNAPPASADGASLCLQALDALAEQPRPVGLPNAGLWSAADHPQGAQWLAANASAISLALEASQRRAICFPLEVDPDSPRWRQGDLARLQTLCRALSDQARALVGQGNVSGGVSHAEAAFKIGTSLAEGPVSAVRTGVTCRAYAAEVIRDILTERVPQEAEARTLLELLGRWGNGQFASLETARHAIRLDALWLPEQLIAEWRHGSAASYLLSQFVTRGLLGRATGRALDRALQADALLQFRARMAETHRGIPGPPTGPGPPRPSVDAAADALVTLTRAEFRGLATDLLADRARVQVLTVAAAARLHEVRSEAPVRGWFDLVTNPLPQVPSDPFSGEPLMMETTEAELIIYSVGPDGDDDGGAGGLLRVQESGDMVLSMPVRATREETQ